MTLSLDHIVILVRDLDAAIRDYTELGFTVQRGGVHADGNTHNALVGFADGSYLELIAFLRAAPTHRWAAAARSAHDGFVDYALLPTDVGAVVQAARARGLDYQGPTDGGRIRPDGERLAWQIGTPPSPDLPFLCGDITPRALRVREGDVRVHANAVRGVASLTIGVRDVRASLGHYLALLGDGAATASQDGKGASLSLGRVRLDLVPAAHEGLQGVALRAGPTQAPQLLPLARTHGAPFTLLPS